MNIELEHYRDDLEHIAPEVHPVLEASFREAARSMSAAGLKTYIEGAKGLTNLGRGNDLVST